MTQPIDLIGLLDHVRVHRVPDSIAPHKPLQGERAAPWMATRPDCARTFTFEEAARPAGELLELAGCSPRVAHPFVRMGTEPIWEQLGDVDLYSSSDVSCVKDPRDPSLRGGYRAEFAQLLRNRSNRRAVVEALTECGLDQAPRDKVEVWLREHGVQP